MQARRDLMPTGPTDDAVGEEDPQSKYRCRSSTIRHQGLGLGHPAKHEGIIREVSSPARSCLAVRKGEGQSATPLGRVERLAAATPSDLAAYDSSFISRESISS